MLRWVRIIIAIVCLGLMTGMMVDYGMTFARLGSWLARIQLLPAALTFSLAIFICWVIATLVFGRIYCSTVCPLGVFQDIFAHVGHRNRAYHTSQPVKGLRYVILAIVFVTVVIGFTALAVFIDPCGIYGRFGMKVLRPLTGWLFNPAAVQMAGASVLGAVIATVVVTIIAAIAWRRGRLYCNTICPVGTTLGFVSKYSIFHIDINTDLCLNCRKCEHVCKSECINMESHTVDGSRCVTCFDCVSVCKNKAIRYTYERHQLSYPLMMKNCELQGCQMSDTPKLQTDEAISGTTK